MKRLPLLLIALTLVFACTDTVTEPEPAIDLVVSYGFEPTPFRMPTINNLEAAAHHLEVLGGHIGSLCPASVPPEPCTPVDLPATSVLGMLGAATNQLTALDSKVDGLLTPPPDDNVPPTAFTDAVVQTFGGAKTVWAAAYLAKLGFEPMPFRDAVWPAFEEVEAGAMAIMHTVFDSGYCVVDDVLLCTSSDVGGVIPGLG